MGAVTVPVLGRSVLVDGVETVNVVDDSVAVVVDPVAGNLPGVCPEVVDQIGVLQVDAGVQNGHHGPSSGHALPGLSDADIGPHGSSGLTLIVKGPLARIQVVGSLLFGEGVDLVDVGGTHPRVPAKAT